jgi:hypothetical protein
MTFKLGSMLLVALIALVALVGCDTARDMVMDTMSSMDNEMTDAMDMMSMDTEMDDASDMEGVPVKLVWLINYPVGGKADYIAWIATVAPTLQAPEELKRVASYDNVRGENPHRLVEFESESIEEANAYQETEEVRAVNTELPNRASRVSQLMFELRSDYVNE